jgi:hypothetical protein
MFKESKRKYRDAKKNLHLLTVDKEKVENLLAEMSSQPAVLKKKEGRRINASRNKQE